MDGFRARLLIESRNQRLLKRRAHPYDGHRRMYRTFAEAIAAGRGTSVVADVLRSATLTVDLDELLQSRRKSQESA